MYDTGKILPGLILFLAVATAPIWLGVARGQEATVPEIEKPVGETECVQEADWMRREHMQLLAQWRDDVVRDGNRVHVSHTGREFDKSLTRTCMGCHTSKAAACDRCHDYLAVSPYCWDCHVDPTAGATVVADRGSDGVDRQGVQ
jgi:hypothetical protein